jgi:DNA segregation ATPase FtsK/SpoIIIE-like protein
MTPNKRRKTKTRARMAATGTNYVRAARAAGAEPLKDRATLSWSPGTIADSEQPVEAVDDFLESRYAHLLVNGISASRPEESLIDMIDQITAANTPEDVQFQIIEPLIQLAEYKNSPYVSGYIDSHNPDSQFLSNVEEMLKNLVHEMNMRNARFVNHTQSPKNLRKAREIALFDAARTGTRLDQHRLWLPYIVVVIHCADSIFADGGTKEERDQCNRIVVAAAELARKSRSAGIFLAMSAHANAPVPAVIRNQTRKIAYRANSSASSLITIGNESLVDLPHDRGIYVSDPDLDQQDEFVRNPFKQ